MCRKRTSLEAIDNVLGNRELREDVPRRPGFVAGEDPAASRKSLAALVDSGEPVDGNRLNGEDGNGDFDHEKMKRSGDDAERNDQRRGAGRRMCGLQQNRYAFSLVSDAPVSSANASRP